MTKKTKKTTIEVEVCDIAVFRHTVSIPTTCPNPDCGADFTAVGKLKVWEYQDQERRARVDHSADDENMLGLEWPDLPVAGDEFIQISFECSDCGTKLAQGKELDG